MENTETTIEHKDLLAGHYVWDQYFGFGYVFPTTQIIPEFVRAVRGSREQEG